MRNQLLATSLLFFILAHNLIMANFSRATVVDEYAPIDNLLLHPKRNNFPVGTLTTNHNATIALHDPELYANKTTTLDEPAQETDSDPLSNDNDAEITNTMRPSLYTLKQELENTANQLLQCSSILSKNAQTMNELNTKIEKLRLMILHIGEQREQLKQQESISRDIVMTQCQDSDLMNKLIELVHKFVSADEFANADLVLRIGLYLDPENSRLLAIQYDLGNYHATTYRNFGYF